MSRLYLIFHAIVYYRRIPVFLNAVKWLKDYRGDVKHQTDNQSLWSRLSKCNVFWGYYLCRCSRWQCFVWYIIFNTIPWKIVCSFNHLFSFLRLPAVCNLFFGTLISCNSFKHCTYAIYTLKHNLRWFIFVLH